MIRATRNTEIDELLNRAIEAGCLVYFITATLSHKLGDDLGAVWSMMQTGYSKAWGGRAARAAGFVGQVRVIETTYGANGFHPHIHAAVVFEAGTAPAAAVGHLEAAGTKYRQSVASQGGYVSTGRNKVTGERLGWNISSCTSAAAVSSYLVKIEGRAKGSASLAMELCRGDLKRASVQLGRGLSQFELLELATAGDVACGRLFATFEAAAKRKHLISISRALRERFPEVVIVSDEEAAVEPEPVLTVGVYQFEPARWECMVNEGRIGQIEVMLYYHHQRGYLLPDWLRACRVA